MQAKSIAEWSKRSILQHFRPSLSYHLSLWSLFCLFLSDRFTQGLLYLVFTIWASSCAITVFTLCRSLSEDTPSSNSIAVSRYVIKPQFSMAPAPKSGTAIMSIQKWAVTCDFQQCGILTSVNSDEPVQPPVKFRNAKWCSVSSFTVIEYASDLQRLWSDCAYEQAGLSLCWLHIPHCWKSHVAAQMYKCTITNVTPDRQQSKTSILSMNVDQIVRNSFWLSFSPNWRQMTIKNTVSSDFVSRSSIA